MKIKNCKICKNKLIGEMVFYPTICLECVVKLGNGTHSKKLEKYKKKA